MKNSEANSKPSNFFWRITRLYVEFEHFLENQICNKCFYKLTWQTPFFVFPHYFVVMSSKIRSAAFRPLAIMFAIAHKASLITGSAFKGGVILKLISIWSHPKANILNHFLQLFTFWMFEFYRFSTSKNQTIMLKG